MHVLSLKFARVLSRASTTPEEAASIKARVGEMFDRIASPPRTVAVKCRLSFDVSMMREITQATKAGSDAIQRQNQSHPRGRTASKKGNARVNPPARIAAHPPTKHGNLDLDFDMTISAPEITERLAKNVVIFLSVRVDAR